MVNIQSHNEITMNCEYVSNSIGITASYLGRENSIFH